MLAHDAEAFETAKALVDKFWPEPATKDGRAPMHSLVGTFVRSHIQQAVALELERRNMTAPQRIDSAPRDGTHIIGHDRFGWREMWFKRDQYEGEYWTDHGDTEPEPTHWIPCPKNVK